MGKALDDRIGCAILLELMEKTDDLSYETYFSFSTQEEVGSRGARALVDEIEPDYVIAIEGTTAADVPGIRDVDVPAYFGKGPAITVMDRSLMASEELVEKLKGCADRYQIKSRLTAELTPGSHSVQKRPSARYHAGTYTPRSAWPAEMT